MSSDTSPTRVDGVSPRIGVSGRIEDDSLMNYTYRCFIGDRLAVGRALDLPVYFGDAGSREVLRKVGAERACAAAVSLDTPGANYRTVWALSKYFPNVMYFPNVQTYVLMMLIMY